MREGLCPKCDTKLEECTAAEAHEAWAEIPDGAAWAARCPADGCDFVIMQHGPGDLRMTLPS